MSLYLSAIDNQHKEHFTGLKSTFAHGAWHHEGILLGLSFTVVQESAARLGFPGAELFTLRLVRHEIPQGSPWNLVELKISEMALHPQTLAVHAGGYQCWSESPMVPKTGILRNEKFPDRKMFGDAPFYTSPERPGQAHSWSYSYSEISGQPAHSGNGFFAALDEELFQARFEFDIPASRFAIAFDTEGASYQYIRTPLDRGTPNLTLSAWIAPHPATVTFPALSESFATLARIYRKYERSPHPMPEKEQAPRRAPIRGYTSWYLHYNAISEEILMRNLEQVAQHNKIHGDVEGNMKVFQVDDGYQARIGDWLTPSSGFPNGVGVIAKAAKERNLEPGIWCAPFIATENSRLFSKHPEWLLRDNEGNLVLCGVHPLWGGRFYALDSENPQYLAHLEKILDMYFKTWEFSFLKADFLYATGRVARAGLTRAQRAARAHAWLYKKCAERGAKLLSCGATLSSAALRCDYSRIGPDVAETWENTEQGTHPSREKVSTRASLVNALTRAALSQSFFGIDPDVFLLRDERIGLTRSERDLVADVNFSVGDLVFTSDEIGTWSPWQLHSHTAKAKRFPKRSSVVSVRCSGKEDFLEVHFADCSTYVLNLGEIAVSWKGIWVGAHSGHWLSPCAQAENPRAYTPQTSPSVEKGHHS
jgi:hypothetical protein